MYLRPRVGFFGPCFEAKMAVVTTQASRHTTHTCTGTTCTGTARSLLPTCQVASLDCIVMEDSARVHSLDVVLCENCSFKPLSGCPRGRSFATGLSSWWLIITGAGATHMSSYPVQVKQQGTLVRTLIRCQRSRSCLQGGLETWLGQPMRERWCQSR